MMSLGTEVVCLILTVSVLRMAQSHLKLVKLALLPILVVLIACATMIVANSNPIPVLFLIRSEINPNLQRPSLSNHLKCHIDVQDPSFLPDMFHSNGLSF